MVDRCRTQAALCHQQVSCEFENFIPKELSVLISSSFPSFMFLAAPDAERDTRNPSSEVDALL